MSEERGTNLAPLGILCCKRFIFLTSFFAGDELGVANISSSSADILRKVSGWVLMVNRFKFFVSRFPPFHISFSIFAFVRGHFDLRGILAQVLQRMARSLRLETRNRLEVVLKFRFSRYNTFI
jgi:hypothetical protein